MKKTIKTLTCLLLVFCLLLSVGCNNRKETPPEKEANINSVNVDIPPQISGENITASEGKEAIITKEEEALLWSYKYLSATEQKIYRIMLNMVRGFTIGWINLGYLGDNGAQMVARSYRALSNDFPEHYWMPVSYYINVNDSQTSVAFKKNDIEDSYGFTKEQVENNATEFSDAISFIAEKALKGKNDFEKELIIHDELCKTVTYDSEFDREGENNIYSAYGALVNLHAVCEGYSRAFKLLCKQVGIQCILVTGTSKGVGHMWNMVELEGSWYHVDVTWDDLRSQYLHTYLNLSELDIRADHDIDINYDKASPALIAQGHSFNFSVPKANETKYNYFRQKGLIIKDDYITPIVDELINAFNRKETKAELLFDGLQSETDFKANYETYVVEIQKQCIAKMGNTYFKLETLSFPSKSLVLYFSPVEKEKKKWYELF